MINHAHLDQLKQIVAGDKSRAEKFFSSLILAYESSVPQYLLDLRRFYSENSTDQMGKVAHSLKSTFGNMGMSELQSIAYEIEKYKGTLPNSQVDANISKIESTHIQDFTTAKQYLLS